MNLFAPLVVVIATTASCAMGNRERRHVLNYLDANWAPQSVAGRWVAAPVALPVGVVAGLTDAVIVHPVTQIDDAWVDTVDVVWDFDAATDFRKVLRTPLSAAATPVVFGVTWVWRSVFDISDSYESPPPPEVEGPEEPESESANKENW